jgi:hypothetical protein
VGDLRMGGISQYVGQSSEKPMPGLAPGEVCSQPGAPMAD